MRRAEMINELHELMAVRRLERMWVSTLAPERGGVVQLVSMEAAAPGLMGQILVDREQHLDIRGSQEMWWIWVRGRGL